MSRGIKLHELTPEAVGLDPVEQPKPAKTLADLREEVRAHTAMTSRIPTKDVALAQLRHAYRHLVSGRTVAKPKSFANLITPAILYLESLDKPSDVE